MSFIPDWIARSAKALQDNKEHLTDLDAAIGDGDHGINMARGGEHMAALDTAEFTHPGTFDAGSYLKKVGMALVSSVGGASGPLYGTFFLRMGATLGTNLIDADMFVKGLEAGLAGLKARGKAEVGEKTMVDVWEPVTLLMREKVAGGADLVTALRAGVACAEEAANKTIDMVATKGRASYLGERSKGTMDPGSASSLLILKAALEAVEADQGAK